MLFPVLDKHSILTNVVLTVISLVHNAIPCYIGDLNGWSDGEDDEDDEEDERVDEIPWRFTSSLTFFESSQEEEYSPCVDLPEAPPDDSGDVFDDGPTSAINVFHLALEGED
ncbi:endonuclease-reverse transcriptase, partial [Plakobranchus ocellatus]